MLAWHAVEVGTSISRNARNAYGQSPVTDEPSIVLLRCGQH